MGTRAGFSLILHRH